MKNFSLAVVLIFSTNALAQPFGSGTSAQPLPSLGSGTAAQPTPFSTGTSAQPLPSLGAPTFPQPLPSLGAPTAAQPSPTLGPNALSAPNVGVNQFGTTSDQIDPITGNQLVPGTGVGIDQFNTSPNLAPSTPGSFDNSLINTEIDPSNLIQAQELDQETDFSNFPESGEGTTP